MWDKVLDAYSDLTVVSCCFLNLCRQSSTCVLQAIDSCSPIPNSSQPAPHVPQQG